jgi:hypothetical protein
MKVCTACNTVYSDDTLNFCLDDGTALTVQKTSSPVQPFSGNAESFSGAEIPTQVSRLPNFSSKADLPPTIASSYSSTPAFIPPNFSASPPVRPKRSFLYLGIVAGAVIFGVAVGILVAVNWSKWSGKGDNFNNNSAVRTFSSPVANSSVPEKKETSLPEFDLIGVWKGKFSDAESTLEITSQKGKTFSGTLNKSGFTVEFVGQVNYETRAVSMKETKVLKTPADGIWYLGNNNGTISADGKKMSGKGKDKNISYDWNYTKQ